MSKHSVDTFIKNVENGNLQSTRAKVYDLLRRRTLNLDELKHYTQMKHQTLTSALSWLADEGLIIMHNKRFYPANADQRGQLKAMRAVDRYNKWVKLGEKEKWFEIYIANYTGY